ncbi:MAG: hypothetical protein Q9159_004533 [Coniocarpon cinnabarinum]
MPAPIGRESSVERPARHQHSSSENIKAHVPMWDSSDPERAPPPLPLNPGCSTPTGSPTKPNTSAAIQAQAQAFVDRARENLTSPYTVNRTPERSPERSAVSAQHRRLQSLQNGSPREFKVHRGVAVESTDSRPTSPHSSRESHLTVSNQLVIRPLSPRSGAGPKSEKDGVARDPSPVPFLSENTPPMRGTNSPKMTPDHEVDVNPFKDLTNGARHQLAHDSEGNQIHSQNRYHCSRVKDLTNVASALHKEMSALSKRSRDNASDLMVLKKSTREVLDAVLEASALQKGTTARSDRPAESSFDFKALKDNSNEILRSLRETSAAQQSALISANDTGSTQHWMAVKESLQELLDAVHESRAPQNNTDISERSLDNAEDLQSLKISSQEILEAVRKVSAMQETALVEESHVDNNEDLQHLKGISQQILTAIHETNTTHQSSVVPVSHPDIAEDFQHLKEASQDILHAIQEVGISHQSAITSEQHVDNTEDFQDLKDTSREILDAINAASAEQQSAVANDHSSDNAEDLQHLKDACQEILSAVKEASHMQNTALVSTRETENPDDIQSLKDTSQDILNAVSEASTIQNEIATFTERNKNNVYELSALKETVSEVLAAVREASSVQKDMADNLQRSKDTANELVPLNKDSTDPNASGEPSSQEQQEPPSKEDVEKLEVMLAQLQIKLEAMDQNVSAQIQTSFNPDVTVKADLSEIETMLRHLQTGVEELSSRPEPAPPVIPAGIAKEDVDALETLMRNVKAKIDDSVVPGIESGVTREDMDNVEALARMTQETVESMANRLEQDSAAKEDTNALTVHLDEIRATIDQIKTQLDAPDIEEKLEEDLNTIKEVCDDIKLKLDDIPDVLPSKPDIEEITEMVAEVRDSQLALKDKYEDDVGITAKAFDDRKVEADKILESVEGLRESIEETRDHLKSRIKRGNEDVRVLDEILQGIEEKIDEIPTTVPDSDEIKETIQGEIARALEAIEGVRTDHEAQCATILEKTEEHENAILGEVLSKLDSSFNELRSGQQEQQQVIGEATLSMTEKQKQQEEMMSSSRAAAEELKVTIDTLGAAVQGIDPMLKDAAEKWSDDAKVVYDKVDDLSRKIEDGAVDSKTDHELTRDEVIKTAAVAGSVQDLILANHPQIMEALQHLGSTIQTNFETSKLSKESSEKISDDLKAHFDEGLRRLPAPQLEAPKVEPVVSIDENVHSKLNEILSKSSSPKYDDSSLHAKMDQLLGYAPNSSEALSRLSGLDELQKQLNAIGTEVSAFVAFQTKMISAEHENKEKEADQAALDLSNSLNEKERIDGDIALLKETKGELSSSIAQQRSIMSALKTECEELNKQKIHLSADVSSLEMALKLRREELAMMDTRADALERRIIEGVMNHSRALLLSKQPRSRAGPDGMNLKRVGSNASHSTAATQQTTRTSTPSIVNSATDMALKARKAKLPGNVPSVTNSPRNDRRIASLSQINNNVASGRHMDASSNRHTSSGLGAGLKRSQSVRTQKTRKSSWQPGNGSLQGISDDDKENESVRGEDRSPTPTPGETDKTFDFSRASSTSRGAPTSTEAAVSQLALTNGPWSSETSASQATSTNRPRTNTAESTKTRQPSRTHSTGSSTRRDSFSTIVTGSGETEENSQLLTEQSTASPQSEMSSYFSGTHPSTVTSSNDAETESTVTTSTDRRRSIGSTLFSNRGSNEDGEGTDVLSDDEGRIDSDVGTTMIPPDHDSVVGNDMPAPLQLFAKGGPQRAPGPDGYDSGLGSDLPTAAPSQGTGSLTDYFQGASAGGADKLEAVDE